MKFIFFHKGVDIPADLKIDISLQKPDGPDAVAGEVVERAAVRIFRFHQVGFLELGEGFLEPEIIGIFHSQHKIRNLRGCQGKIYFFQQI